MPLEGLLKGQKAEHCISVFARTRRGLRYLPVACQCIDYRHQNWRRNKHWPLSVLGGSAMFARYSILSDCL